MVTDEQPSKRNEGGHGEVRFKVFQVHINKVLFVGVVISLGFFESPGLFSSEQCSPFVAEFKTCEIAFF